jgi:phage terminase Nu1 subunit (DNA packaging protein)
MTIKGDFEMTRKDIANEKAGHLYEAYCALDRAELFAPKADKPQLKEAKKLIHKQFKAQLDIVLDRKPITA